MIHLTVLILFADVMLKTHGPCRNVAVNANFYYTMFFCYIEIVLLNLSIVSSFCIVN